PEIRVARRADRIAAGARGPREGTCDPVREQGDGALPPMAVGEEAALGDLATDLFAEGAGRLPRADAPLPARPVHRDAHPPDARPGRVFVEVAVLRSAAGPGLSGGGDGGGHVSPPRTARRRGRAGRGRAPATWTPSGRSPDVRSGRC